MQNIRWCCGRSTASSAAARPGRTFGLIDTAEKSAEVLVKVYSMGGMKQTITREELIALGKRFNVQPLQSALDLYP
jgi:rhamnulose-1-phosphate aldolase